MRSASRQFHRPALLISLVKKGYSGRRRKTRRAARAARMILSVSELRMSSRVMAKIS